jgi:hypothetical protein
MSDEKTLRKRLIRLAFARPDLRADLLPLVREAVTARFPAPRRGETVTYGGRPHRVESVNRDGSVVLKDLKSRTLVENVRPGLDPQWGSRSAAVNLRDFPKAAVKWGEGEFYPVSMALVLSGLAYDAPRGRETKRLEALLEDLVIDLRETMAADGAGLVENEAEELEVEFELDSFRETATGTTFAVAPQRGRRRGPMWEEEREVEYEVEYPAGVSAWATVEVSLNTSKYVKFVVDWLRRKQYPLTRDGVAYLMKSDKSWPVDMADAGMLEDDVYDAISGAGIQVGMVNEDALEEAFSEAVEVWGPDAAEDAARDRVPSAPIPQEIDEVTETKWKGDLRFEIALSLTT